MITDLLVVSKNVVKRSRWHSFIMIQDSRKMCTNLNNNNDDKKTGNKELLCVR